MKCGCAYCKEGMSKSAEECLDRMVEVGKSLKESIKDVDWRLVFKNMYHKGEKCQRQLSQ